jgi:hypothetical protein
MRLIHIAGGNKDTAGKAGEGMERSVSPSLCFFLVLGVQRQIGKRRRFLFVFTIILLIHNLSLLSTALCGHLLLNIDANKCVADQFAQPDSPE